MQRGPRSGRGGLGGRFPPESGGSGGVVPPGSRDQVDQHHRGRAGQGGHHLVHHRGAGELLAAVPVTVAGDEHLRLDLGEPVDHAARAEIRRARRPDRAQARGGEQADDRLGHVRQQRRHPVAAANPQRAQATGHPRHLGGELSVAEAPGPASFGIKDYGRTVGIGPRGPQRVTGVVQGGAVEPPYVGHDRAGQGRSFAPFAEHLEVVPDRRPELPGLRHRPLPKILIAAQVQLVTVLQPAHEAGHPGLADRLVIRLPEHRAVAAAQHITLARFHAFSIVPSRHAWQRPARPDVAQIMINRRPGCCVLASGGAVSTEAVAR